ncbi:MAG TPA: CdaR family protein, partial [Candidatus Limnocylindria bacterium]|nr:CdaR family protein [Candidatus Limnocylindria bacterium]
TPRMITVTFDGRVPVERPEVAAGYVLRGQLGDVGVTLRGQEGVADRVALSDLHATLDMTSLQYGLAGPQDAKVHVTVAKENVEVVDISPATVSVRLERVVSRSLPVQARFSNTPPPGSRAGDAVIVPTDVKVTGPESSIAQIAAAYATVRFGDAMTDITGSSPAIPVDASGTPIDGLTVEPGLVTVAVPVLPTATTRTVPVVFTLRGTVAPGYWVSAVAMDPFAVTVRGEENVLSSLDRIETLPVDIGGFNSTRSLRVALALPSGVTLLRPTDVAVTVTVQPLTGTRPFTVGVQVTGLSANQSAETDPATVAVLVAGPMPGLNALTVEQVLASVDAGGRPPGTYAVDVAIRVPSGLTVQTVQPARVTLTIRSR